MRGRTRAGDGSNDAELVLPSGNRDEGRHRHQQHAKDTRLFDKLNQLERKWHSQKGNNNNKLAIGGVSLNQNHSFSSQRDPPPGSPPIEATGSMPPPSEALPVSSTSTEPKQLPPKKKKKKKKEGPRVVTMFDRLYQKGKAKAITKNITVLPQTKPSANRNKRRLRAAIIIQSVFRGVKLRKHVRYLSGTAFVIQWWWRNIAQRLFYIRLRGLTIIIQSLERRRVAIKAAQEIRGSAATIQSLWRMRCAKRQRKMLEEDLEKRIRESNASKLIQFHLRKHIKVIRQQRVECVSLMVEEINDGVETLSGDSSTSESISSDHPPDLILSADSLEENPSDEAGEADEEKRKVTPNEDKLAPTEDSAKPLEHDEKPSVSSASASLFRAAQLRRRALKQPVSNVPQDTVARSVLAHRRKNLGIKEGTVPPRKYKSIAYEYLPTNKTYWTYDSHKLARIPIIQRWAKKRMREKLLWRSSVNIQCAWRINRSQFELISLYLLKEWAVRVDFRQEETTNNPVLRQKVRLLALAKAIRQVNDESLPPEVLRTPYSFVVNWKTETSIYFAEDQGIAQLNRCRIHVVCEAHRHPLWEDWSNQKKFTHLSKVALLRSFSNQCARLSRASVLMQSLRMRRILWKMAREKEAAMTIQRFWSRYGHETDEMVYLQQAKSAAIRLQAFWRMTSAVLLLEIQDMSASSIQALFRGFTIREQYLEAKFGITGFQAVYRGRREYRSFNLKCRTVLHIQRAIRGFIARARLDHQAYAALAIQDWYRAVALRVCMSKIRLSYSILQCLVQRQAILSRLQKEQAAVRLQAWLRKVSCRSFHLQQIQSGTHVQSVYRGWQARKAFCIVVRGVVLLQASARTRRDQELFSQWKRSANAIRGVWLTYITRTRFLRLCRVVSIVQTLMRERRARRSSATRLSAWWRTCVCLRHIDESKKLAVTVQKIFRGHQGRLRHKHLSYLRLYAAAAKLQSWWRLNLAFDAYTIMQLSVVDIQRSYRAYSARQRYKIALQTLKTASATKLQGWWRMAIACETYNVLYVSVWDVQRCYRGYRTRKALVEARMYLGAVKFQALWRVSHMRSIFKKLCHATMTLQRVYRGHKTRSEIQNARMCSAETHLAAAWRRFHARKCYKDLCRSAILAQRICRGHLGRKRFEFLHAQHVFRTATKLQAFCRMCAQSKRFTKVCASALLAQRIVRGCVARRRYNALVEAHFAAVLIQAAWDDYRDRMATRLYLAIVSVQKCYRGYQVRSSIDPLAAFFYSKGKACGYLRLMHYNSYRQMQASSLVLQRWQRMTTCKRDFEELKMGVAAIQACFRGYSARCSFHEQVEAATIIQAWRRMTVKVEDFEEMLVASIIIQSLFRGFSQRRQTKASLRAFVAIQSLFRMRRCVQNLYECREVAIRLQSLYRRSKELKSFTSLLSAVVSVQTAWRRAHHRSRFTLFREKAIKIQCWLRCLMAKRQLKRRKMATKIQCWVRCLVAKTELETLALARRMQAAITIQKTWRGALHCSMFILLKNEAIKIQCWLRCLMAHRELSRRKMALKIQCWVRCQLAIAEAERRAHAKCTQAAITLQKTWRCALHCSMFTLLKDEAIKIQCWVRCLKAHTELRRRKMAITIQCWRRCQAAITEVERRAHAKCTKAAIKMQKTWRCAHHCSRFALMKKETIKIQCLARALMAKGEAKKRAHARCMKAATTMQKTWRCSHQISNFRMWKKAAIKAQSLIRCLMAKKQAQQRSHAKHMYAATRIQTTWRCCHHQSRFLSWKATAIKVQCLVRCLIAQNKGRKLAHLKCTQAATKIQTIWRCYIHQVWFFELLLSSTCIQDSYRSYKARCHLHSMAAQIQNWWRTLKTEKKHHACAIQLQAFYRSYKVRCQLLEQFDAADTIQHWYRRRRAEIRREGFLHALAQERSSTACRRQDTLLSDCSVSIHEFGDVTREYQLCSILTFPADKTELSATLIATAYRMYSSKKAYSKVVLAVVTIQKNWRAYSGRKRKIFTRAIIHEEGIEVEQVQQLTWLKRLRTISAVLVQTWYRANKERRKYLSLQRKRAEQRAEQQPAVPVGSKSPIQDPSIGANSVDTVRVDEATHITLLSPLWLFRPEVVLSMPVSIASCLDSSRAAKATGTMDMSTSFHGAKQEETVADEIRPSTNNTKEDRPAATTLAMMSNPVTRAEVLHQLRLIVSSVCRLQAWSRGRLERLFEIRMEMASILAAVFRGVRVRRFVLRIRSAMLIQSQFRAQVCSLEFQRMRKGFSSLQLKWAIYSSRPEFIARIEKRNKGLSAFQRVVKEQYRIKSTAVFKIQRQWKLRRGFIKLQKVAKRRYNTKTRAAVRLQQFWRMTSAKSAYLRLKSAILLQKFWRMASAKLSYSRLKAAILLQKFWRMTSAQSSYSRLRSAIRLQKFWRMTSAQSSYLLLRSMAVRLQSRWRCFSMRSSFCVQLDGFCCLQQLARKSHETKTLAVVVLQTQARMKIMVDKYLRKQWASSLLQKACRGHLACSRYRKMYNGFRHVQQRAQQRFLDKTVASVLIQRFWRMETQRAKFDKLFIGVISLQKLAIEAFARKSDAATDIQARWRCHTNYCILQEKKEASITIQQYQRRHSSRTKTQKMKSGFLTLRVLGQDRFQKKTKAVIRLQRFWRMLSCSMEYFAIIGATIALQSRWRSHSCRTKWITFCHGFTRLQLLAHRAYIRKTAAATLIQRVWRRYSALVAYETSLLSVILVQSHWRRHKCEGRFAVQLRGFSNLRDLGKAQFSLKTVSATAIQAQWRKSFAKHNLSIVRAAAISIQAQIRGKMQRAAYSMMIPGFVSLQVLAKLWFRIKNTCAVKIQTAARRMAAQKRFQFQQGASVTIQCVFRGFVQRRNLAVLRWLHSIAATMLASWWRRIACESRYQRLRYATLALQFRVRRRRRERASIKIESWWRCLRQRQAYLREISAITLQALWRSWRQRRVYTRILGAISIQAWWRCLSQRRAYLRDMAAIKLQSWYRFFVQRQLYLLQKRSAMKIETTARLYLTFCRERHAAARKIQESWLDAKKRFILRCLIAVRRRANAAKLIQRRYREVLLSRRQEELLREVEAETKRALDETMSVFSNEYLLSRSASTMSWQSQYPNKAQSCTASSMFCNFDFSMAALAMPWGGLTKNASGRSVCGDDSSSRRRKDPKKPATIREEARRMRSAILIQREWRMFQSKRKKELYYKNISSAWIQCIWRGYAARKRAEKIRRDAAATRIQKAWLRAQIRKLEFLQCVRLQSFCRMVHWKTQFAIIRASSHDAAASIQGLWRMYSARVSFKRLVSVALTLQRVTRENIRKEKAARKIQNVWWIYRIRREVFDQKKNSTSSLPAMVLQAGLAWVLSDPRVIEFALNGGI